MNAIFPNDCTVPFSKTLLRLVQFAKVAPPIVVTPAGTSILSRPAQLEKAPSMFTKLAGKFIDVISLHASKALRPIVDNCEFAANVTLASLLHSPKELAPISVKDAGNRIEFNDLQP